MAFRSSWVLGHRCELPRLSRAGVLLTSGERRDCAVSVSLPAWLLHLGGRPIGVDESGHARQARTTPSQSGGAVWQAHGGGCLREASVSADRAVARDRELRAHATARPWHQEGQGTRFRLVGPLPRSPVVADPYLPNPQDAPLLPKRSLRLRSNGSERGCETFEHSSMPRRAVPRRTRVVRTSSPLPAT